jgi:hypothetical protein
MQRVGWAKAAPEFGLMHHLGSTVPAWRGSGVNPDTLARREPTLCH